MRLRQDLLLWRSQVPALQPPLSDFSDIALEFDKVASETRSKKL